MKTSGSFVAAMALLVAPHAAHAADWTPTALPWRNLPSQIVAGPAPRVFAVPAKAWDYGASSAPVDVFAKADITILEVDVQVRGGQVGVSLMSLDGVQILSKEKMITPQLGAIHVYFRIRPGERAGMIVLRNYDAEGQPGTVEVTRTLFAHESSLSNEELSAVVQAGLL